MGQQNRGALPFDRVRTEVRARVRTEVRARVRMREI